MKGTRETAASKAAEWAFSFFGGPPQKNGVFFLGYFGAPAKKNHKTRNGALFGAPAKTHTHTNGMPTPKLPARAHTSLPAARRLHGTDGSLWWRRRWRSVEVGIGLQHHAAGHSYVWASCKLLPKARSHTTWQKCHIAVRYPA